MTDRLDSVERQRARAMDRTDDPAEGLHQYREPAWPELVDEEGD